jgi:putative aldouronate transport system substrate-binding protein
MEVAKMKRVMKKTLLGLAAAILVVALAGCAGGTKNNPQPTKEGGASVAPATPTAPTEILISTITYGNSPSSDLEGFQKVNEKLNVKLSVNYIPVNNMTEKMNALLASKDLTDVVFIDSFNETPSYATALEQGAFWDLTPYIQDYPNLAAYPEDIWENAKYNGKIVSLPRVRPLDGQIAMIIRQDWLEKLDLKAPETLEQLRTVMDAFTKQDPDGNQKADTYGAVFMGSPSPNLPMYIFGVDNGWHEDANGNLTPEWMMPEFREGLKFFAEAFAAGTIMPDFPVLKTQQVKEMLVQGKAGIGFTSVIDAYNYTLDLQKSVPDGKFQAYQIPMASDGKRHYNQASGFYGQLLVNKKVSEEKLKKILEVFDYTATKEGYNLISYGIEGVDYTVSADGNIEQTEDGKKKGYPDTSQWLSGYYNPYQRAEAPGIPQEIKEYNYKLLDAITPQSKPDPMFGTAASAAFREKGSEWNKKRFDLTTNIVISKNSLEDWDKFVQQMKDDPDFQKYIEETNENVKQKNG